MAAATTKASAQSVESTNDSTSLNLEVLQEMETATIKSLLEQTEKECEAMLKENFMFEKFFERIDPKDIAQLVQQQKPAAAVASNLSSNMELKAHRKRARSRASTTHTERLIQLTVEQKFDIATRELDELKEEILRKKDESEKCCDNHKAVMMEADIRRSDIKKAVYEFERDIVRGAINQRTKKILGEKVTRYFEDRLKAKDSLVDKLRLKNATLKARRVKLQTQLKQKEEAGDVRHEVDFEQLKIENKQYNEHYEGKNQELLRLKLSAGNTLQVLNAYKKKLHTLSLESSTLTSEMKHRRELLEKIETETNTVTKEKQKAEQLNKEARKQLEDYRVPDVMEYVGEKASLYELGKTVRAWERKVEIAELALRSYKQTWRRLCQQSKELNAAATGWPNASEQLPISYT